MRSICSLEEGSRLGCEVLGGQQDLVGFPVTAYAVASFAGTLPLTLLLRVLPRRPALWAMLVGYAARMVPAGRQGPGDRDRARRHHARAVAGRTRRDRARARRLARDPGHPPPLGHQVMYTYVAPLAQHAGFGRAGPRAPKLIQTELVDASGPAHADVATSPLEHLGAGALPWTSLPLVAGGFFTVAFGRRRAFPAVRRRS